MGEKCWPLKTFFTIWLLSWPSPCILTTFCGMNWSCFLQSSLKSLTLFYKFKGLGFILSPTKLVLVKVWELISIARDIFLWKLTAILEKHFFSLVSISFKLQVLNKIWILLKIGWHRVRKDNANALTGAWITRILFTLSTISISGLLLLCDIFRIWVGDVSYFWYVILHMQGMDHVYEQRILHKMSY